ncbi:MAG: hypothetical protein WDM96_06740 [Lacunisphaera sp.]
MTRSRASGNHYSAGSEGAFVPGIDGTGSDESGRRVYFVMPEAPFGGMAEKTVVKAALCVALPPQLDSVKAAALANPGMSSWAALKERARFAKGRNGPDQRRDRHLRPPGRADREISRREKKSSPPAATPRCSPR